MDPKENYVAKHDKLVSFLGMTIEEVSPDYARVSMPVTENHKNGMGVAHGGAIFALADAAFGAAANADRQYGVVNLVSSIEFLRPGKKGPLIGEARIVREGGHIISYDVKILDGEKNLIARAITSGYVTNVRLPE